MTEQQKLEAAEKEVLAAPDLSCGLKDLRRVGDYPHDLVVAALNMGCGFVAGPVFDESGAYLRCSGTEYQRDAFLMFAGNRGMTRYVNHPHRGYVAAYFPNAATANEDTQRDCAVFRLQELMWAMYDLKKRFHDEITRLQSEVLAGTRVVSTLSQAKASVGEASIILEEALSLAEKLATST